MSVLLPLLALALLGLWRQHGAALQQLPPGNADPVLCDFRGTVYYPAVSFLEGHNPYDPTEQLGRYPVTLPLVGYAPHVLLMNAPVGALPYAIAAPIYQLLLIALTGLLAWLALRFGAVPWSWERHLGLTTLLLVTRPGQINFGNGHMALQFTLAAYLAMHYGTRRPGLAAVGLALCLAKPTIGVPLAALMLLGRGEVRATMGGGLLAAALSAMTLGRLLGAAGSPAALLASVQAGSDMFRQIGANDPASTWLRVDALALVAKLSDHAPPALVAAAIALGIVVLGIVGLRRIGAARRDLGDLLICLTILVFAYQQVYAVLVLVLPLVRLLWRTPTRPLRANGLRWLVAAPMCIPFLNFASTVIVANRLGMSGLPWRLVTLVNPLVLLLAWCTVLALSIRRVDTQWSQ